MSLFGDSPRSRFNTFGHQTGCTIISSRLAAQKSALENYNSLCGKTSPKTKVGILMQHPVCAGRVTPAPANMPSGCPPLALRLNETSSQIQGASRHDRCQHHLGVPASLRE